MKIKTVAAGNCLVSFDVNYFYVSNSFVRCKL